MGIGVHIRLERGYSQRYIHVVHCGVNFVAIEETGIVRIVVGLNHDTAGSAGDRAAHHGVDIRLCRRGDSR